VIGTTLIVSQPPRGYGVSHIELPSFTPWPGGPRRTFSRGQVVALGKLRRYGDNVARFVVRLTDGAKVQIIGTEQSTQERLWLDALGSRVPIELTSRQTPWTLAWIDLRVRCPIGMNSFHRKLFSGNPPHAPHVYGWIVRLGGSATPEQRAWLKSHGYCFSGGKWCRAAENGRPDNRAEASPCR
jgi:hypothetical protein